MLGVPLILLAFTGGILAVRQNFRQIGNYEYLISEQKLNWFRAAHFCNSIDADLASIESESELLAISSYLKNIGKGSDDWYWFDGNDLGEQGQYYSLSTGRLKAFTRWAKDEPNNYDGKQHCMCLWKRDDDFEMSDWECENTAYFICKPRQDKCLDGNRTTSTAPDSFGYLQEQIDAKLRKNFEQVGDEFYYFGATRETWHRSDLLCRKRGGNLLTIESTEENQVIGNTLTAKGIHTTSKWIDGIDADRNRRIISLFTGKILSDFAGQPVRSPHRACVIIKKSGSGVRMYEHRCDATEYYICKARKPEIVNVYGSQINGIRT